MKKALLLSILIMVIVNVNIYAKTATIRTLKEMMKVFTMGGTIRGVFHYNKCQLISENKIEEKVPDAIGGMVLDSWEYFASRSIGNKEAFLSASKKVLISHPRYGLVYNYVKLRIFDSGKVRIIAQYIDPKTFKVVMDESFYTEIGEGAFFFGEI